ncbi:hypothetical protein KR084_008277, partial [Drosophila pseudotakahashii]
SKTAQRVKMADTNDLNGLAKLQADRHEALKATLQCFRKDAMSRKTAIYFQKRLQKVDDLKTNFLETHTRMVCTEGFEETPYYLKGLASEFEERYLEVYCSIDESYKQTHAPEPPPVTPQPLHKAEPAIRVNLPQIPVPKFSGNIIEWPGFYDIIYNPRIVFAHHMNALYNLSTLHKEKAKDLRSLLSTVKVCTGALQRISGMAKEPTHWLAHYVSTKLPKETHAAWEHYLGSNTEVPSFLKLEQFLNDRLVTIDGIENRNASFAQQLRPSTDSTRRIQYHNTQTRAPSNLRCVHCGSSHILRRCPAFLSMDSYQRKELAIRFKLCINCLGTTHTHSRCTSTRNCQQCGQRHHTLLHHPQRPPHPQETQSTPVTNTSGIQPAFTAAQTPQFSNSSLNCLTAVSSNAPIRSILLATARVHIINPKTGQEATINALLDHRSEATLVSKHTVQSLRLKKVSTRTTIAGVGAIKTQQCKATVSFSIRPPSSSSPSLEVGTAYVLNSLTAFLPGHSILSRNWEHLTGLALADPQFYRSKRIDIIIGADLLSQILLPGLRTGSAAEPMAQNTIFGWVLSGQAGSAEPNQQLHCYHTAIDTEHLLKQFCDIEAVPERHLLSPEESWCEEFFKETHRRLENGRYEVRLPFKTLFDSEMTIGRSHQMALNRFLHLERRLKRSPDEWIRYGNGFNEYFELGQITQAKSTERQNTQVSASNISVSSCVLPHHAESLSTKHRIVFDASAKTSNGRSLNDILCVGRALQNNLAAVILNWRKYPYAFTADIQKMYRCINVHHDDHQYQRILWRAADGGINEYCLTTVTFGTASARLPQFECCIKLAKTKIADIR